MNLKGKKKVLFYAILGKVLKDTIVNDKSKTVAILDNGYEMKLQELNNDANIIGRRQSLNKWRT